MPPGTESGLPMSFPNGRPRRLLWCVNHRALLPAEVPILRSLGYEVLIPKRVPDHDSGFRSALVTYEYDTSLTISAAALEILNRHNFYEVSWPPTLRWILNKEFDVIISHFSYYTTPISEAARYFRGHVVARTFGREHPRRYSEFADIGPRKGLLAELEALGQRFVHAQGYSNVSEIEPQVLQRTAHTVTVPLPNWIYKRAGTWSGEGRDALFLCPAIIEPGVGGYYMKVYEGIRRDFGDLPYLIFGRQNEPVDDPRVLPYLTDDDLLALYARVPVFIYPSEEPRHVHYSPIEAMVVGTPVLYRRGALIDTLAEGADLPGACASAAEMHEKARRLLAGDGDLAASIRTSQCRIVGTFSTDLARRQWAAALRVERDIGVEHPPYESAFDGN